MQLGRVFDIAAAIVGVALLFVAVSHPATATIIKNSGEAFAGALRASMGQ